MAEWISIIVAVAFMVAIPIAIVRVMCGGLQQGRGQPGQSSGSIIGSSMIEMDRLLRPSSEHVVQAEDDMKLHEDDIGGE